MRYSFILLLIFSGCIYSENPNSINQSIEQQEKDKLNSFDEYCQLVPDIKVPITLGQDDKLIPPLSFETQLYLERSNYGPSEGYYPIGKIVRDSFTAIIGYTPLDYGDCIKIFTFNKLGKEKNKEIIYSMEGIRGNHRIYAIEKCITYIDKNLDIDYKYSYSEFSDSTRSDTINRKIIQKKYRIDNLGTIIEIK